MKGADSGCVFVCEVGTTLPQPQEKNSREAAECSPLRVDLKERGQHERERRRRAGP